MNKKYLFVTFGLAATLALGGCSLKQSVKEVAAEEATTTIYCKMEHSWWTADGAAIGVYYWKGETPHASWPGERGTLAEGETNIWKFDIAADADGLIFTRVNGSGTISDWGAKTKDLTLPTDGNNLFTISNETETWGDPGCDGTWSVYETTPEPEPEPVDTTTIYCKMEHSWWTADGAAIGVYYWKGETPHASWPGERGTLAEGETNIWKFDIAADAEGLIFTRVNGSGTISDWGAKTKDLTLPTDGNNLFTISNETETWGDPGCDGVWSVYGETPEPQPETPVFKVVGSMNEWSYADSTIGFVDATDPEEVEKGYYKTQQKAEFHVDADDVFKINDGADIWYGGKDLPGYDFENEEDFSYSESGNFIADEAGTVTLFLKVKAGESADYYALYIAFVADEHVYSVKVGETVKELVLNEGNEYMTAEMDLVAGQKVQVLKDGQPDASFVAKAIGNNNVAVNEGEISVLVASEGQKVYVDLNAKTIYVGGLVFGGYHLLVNGKFVEMTKNENPMDPEYREYSSGMLSFKKDDVVRFIDTTGGEEYTTLPRIFDITKINEHSLEGCFDVVEGKLVAQKDCEVSVYLKLKYEADEVYFGDVKEEVKLAAEFAKQFNESIGGICTWNNTTDEAALKAAWEAQVAKFNALNEAVQEELKKADKSHNVHDIAEFIGKYEYVASKYGTKLGEGYNFLAKDLTLTMSAFTNTTVSPKTNAIMIAIVSIIALTSVASIVAVVVIKKRRLH